VEVDERNIQRAVDEMMVMTMTMTMTMTMMTMMALTVAEV
jgi:hypothetical protein